MSHELGALSAFRSFPEAALETLAVQATPQDLTTGDVLFCEGDAGDSVFVVASGEIEIRKGNRVLARLHAGRTVGEMALLEEESRSAEAVATEATRVFRFDRVALAEFLQTHPECGAPFFFETGREMSRRLRSTSEYLLTVFEVGRIVASGLGVEGLVSRIIERLLRDFPEADAGRVLLRHPLAEDVEVVGRGGDAGLDDDTALAVATRAAPEPGYQAIVDGHAVLGATLTDDRGEVMGAVVIEKKGDESPFTVEQEIVLEAVAHQAEQGILAAWARAEQADRERLDRHRLQGY